MTLEPAILDRLGDELERAAARDLPPRRRRRWPFVAIAAALSIPAAAYAAERLTSADDVARSMPAGTLSLAGTEPTCTVVTENVEFHCVLARPPAPEVADWKGTVEPTVDSSKHVNGGCRSLRSDGTEWECYLGTAAVDQAIVSAAFLGQAVQGPGAG